MQVDETLLKVMTLGVSLYCGQVTPRKAILNVFRFLAVQQGHLEDDSKAIAYDRLAQWMSDNGKMDSKLVRLYIDGVAAGLSSTLSLANEIDSKEN